MFSCFYLIILLNLSHFIGMWSSIFSKNLLDAWHAADNSEDFWHRWTQATVTEIGKSCFILSFIAFDFYLSCMLL